MSERADLPDLCARQWDLLVIGGGITGAGILLEAARRGLKALLVEQGDFASGTSSRSSKLVHGGLRYLKQGQLRLTRESVHEREALLRDAPGLVEPQGFVMPDYGDSRGTRRKVLLGLALYDYMAGRRQRHWAGATELALLAPNIRRDGLAGGMRYTDAKTDDARLVLRVLDEARTHAAVALNYVAVQSLRRGAGRVEGALLCDRATGATHTVHARLVVNATGAWAGALGAAPKAPRLRPLRGSHLLLPAWRLPLAQSVTLMHPDDGRPVFAYPWEGVTLVGTTDVDHAAGLAQAPVITRAEFDYLMTALRRQFPQLGLNDADVLATFAGVRPVLDGGTHGDPSREGRDHAVWSEDGLLTVTGGKLTTFRAIALDALRHARPQLPGWGDALAPRPLFAAVPAPTPPCRMARASLRRLMGRYGGQAQALLDAARPGELEPVPGTETLWAELRWAARTGQVHRLDDLLLRRTRLGLQLPRGGPHLLGRIRAICQPELGWSDQRWQDAQEAYLALCAAEHGVPARADNDNNDA